MYVYTHANCIAVTLLVWSIHVWTFFYISSYLLGLWYILILFQTKVVFCTVARSPYSLWRWRQKGVWVKKEGYEKSDADDDTKHEDDERIRTCEKEKKEEETNSLKQRNEALCLLLKRRRIFTFTYTTGIYEKMKVGKAAATLYIIVILPIYPTIHTNCHHHRCLSTGKIVRSRRMENCWKYCLLLSDRLIKVEFLFMFYHHVGSPFFFIFVDWLKKRNEKAILIIFRHSPLFFVVDDENDDNLDGDDHDQQKYDDDQ